MAVAAVDPKAQGHLGAREPEKSHPDVPTVVQRLGHFVFGNGVATHDLHAERVVFECGLVGAGRGRRLRLLIRLIRRRGRRVRRWRIRRRGLLIRRRHLLVPGLRRLLVRGRWLLISRRLLLVPGRRLLLVRRRWLLLIRGRWLLVGRWLLLVSRRWLLVRRRLLVRWW